MTRHDIPDETGDWAIARLPIEGLRCLSCVLRVESALEDVPEVLNASVDLAEATATVAYRPGAVTQERLVQAVSAAGYRVTPGTPDEDSGA